MTSGASGQLSKQTGIQRRKHLKKQPTSPCSLQSRNQIYGSDGSSTLTVRQSDNSPDTPDLVTCLSNALPIVCLETLSIYWGKCICGSLKESSPGNQGSTGMGPLPVLNGTVVLYTWGQPSSAGLSAPASTCVVNTSSVLVSWDVETHMENTKVHFLLPVCHWGWSGLGIWGAAWWWRLLANLEGPPCSWLGLRAEQSSSSNQFSCMG